MASDRLLEQTFAAFWSNGKTGEIPVTLVPRLRRAAPRRHPACGHLANRHPANQIIFFLDGRATNIAAHRRLLETRSPSLKHRRSVIDRISLNCLPRLYEGQEATVLQLPVETHTAAEAKKREPGSITA